MELLGDISVRLMRTYGKDAPMNEILALLQFNVLWNRLVCPGLLVVTTILI